jgi:hypothetical protein
MSWRVIAGLLFLYVIIILLSGVATETYFGGNSSTIVSLILTPPTPSYTNPIGGISTTFSIAQAWLNAFLQAMFLDFPIFYGPYQIVRILILCVFGGVIVFQVISGIRPA